MQLLKRILCGLAAAAMLFCALYALGALDALKFLPTSLPEHRVEWMDAEGNSWTGDYLANEKRYEGDVRIVFADGSLYVGGFRDGHFEGAGRYTFADGSSVEGEFVAGVLTELEP